MCGVSTSPTSLVDWPVVLGIWAFLRWFYQILKGKGILFDLFLVIQKSGMRVVGYRGLRSRPLSEDKWPSLPLSPRSRTLKIRGSVCRARPAAGEHRRHSQPAPPPGPASSSSWARQLLLLGPSAFWAHDWLGPVLPGPQRMTAVGGLLSKGLAPVFLSSAFRGLVHSHPRKGYLSE